MILPMLASPTTGAGNRTPVSIESLAGTHAFDLKLDGIRALAFWNGTSLTLVNRNGVNITAKYPELVAPFEAHFTGHPGYVPLVIDGEIVADDGRFETVLTRDKQTSSAAIAAGVAQHPTHFVAFDRPDVDDTWLERRLVLDNMVLPERWTRSVWSLKPSFQADVAAQGMEGVIAKRLTSRYRPGRSGDWLKFKNLHRVSCLASGYAAGTGSRTAFGAMFLALIDEHNEVVPCGRVGTGMTGRDLTELKTRLDAREIFVVEIECLGLTSGNVLRMPVYRGIRTDVVPTSCTTAQLATLPRS